MFKKLDEQYEEFKATVSQTSDEKIQSNSIKLLGMMIEAGTAAQKHICPPDTFEDKFKKDTKIN